jgi:hypothetical protein
MELEYSGLILEKYSNMKFTKIHPEVAKLFNANGQT